jgi:drug/metabolite transporter (DMT)-like permease
MVNKTIFPKVARKPMKNIAIIYILISILGGAAGQVMLKKGMALIGPLTLDIHTLGNTFLHLATNPFVLLGLFTYALSTVFWLAALSRVDLSYAYPFASLSYVGMLIASWLIFKEDISLLRLAGCLVVGMGVFLISRS